MTAASRKPRWWLRILWSVVALLIVVGAAELILRAVIPSIVAEQIRQQLGFGTDAQIEVELDGSALWPALSGRVGPIRVEIPDIEVIDGIVTTVQVSADSVPFDPSQGSIEGAHGTVTIPAASIGPVISLITQQAADAGEVQNSQLVVSRTMEIFGQTATLSVELALAVDEGQVQITPLAIQAAGFDLTAEELNEVTDGSMAAVLTAQDLCVREQIPAGITLTDIRLLPSGAVTISADFAADILSNPAQQKLGVCGAGNG